MSSTPGALEIVRDAFERMRTAVPVAPPTREERAAAWERMSQSLAGWSVPTDDAAITGFDPAKPGSDQTVIVRRGLPTSVRDCLEAKPGSEQSFVFRTKLPEATWRELAPPPAVEIVKLRGHIAKLTEAYDVRGQALRETYEERDRALAKVAELEARVAAFTAQNVRPLDDKPEPPAILRAIRPSRTDPRRLGLA